MNNKDWKNKICEVCYKITYNEKEDHKEVYLYDSVLGNVPRITFYECNLCDKEYFIVQGKDEFLVMEGIETLEEDKNQLKENILYVISNYTGIKYYKKINNIYIFNDYLIEKKMLYVKKTLRYIFWKENIKFIKEDLIDFHHKDYTKYLFETNMNLEILKGVKDEN